MYCLDIFMKDICTFLGKIKEERSGGTVDWAQKLQTSILVNLVGLFWLHCKYLNARSECNDTVISVYSHYPLDLNAKSSETSDWLPKFVTGKKCLNRHRLKSIWVIILFFCQSDPLMSEQFWQKDFLIYAYLNILAQLQILVISL